MGAALEDPRLFRLFAGLLDYPGPELPATVRRCAELLSLACPAAAEALARFADFVERTSPAGLEELYIRAFELGAAYCPYVGHHLFGESYKRSVFLVRLKERCRAVELALDGELPDHLTVLLRFLAVCPQREEGEELIREALLPALDTMLRLEPEVDSAEVSVEAVEGGCRPSPYGWVLRALRLWLNALVPAREAEPPPPAEEAVRRRVPLPVLDAWPLP